MKNKKTYTVGRQFTCPYGKKGMKIEGYVSEINSETQLVTINDEGNEVQLRAVETIQVGRKHSKDLAAVFD
ncbi:hypothetical protein GOV13_04490 [Candidatus Pacearchaeota archaeon]|nr:hypothetical protein [Candidatus Pacearchaeota archaeon]